MPRRPKPSTSRSTTGTSSRLHRNNAIAPKTSTTTNTAPAMNGTPCPNNSTAYTPNPYPTQTLQHAVDFFG